MENTTCQMNCHQCTLQSGAEAKRMCATLLMPSMFAQLISELSELREQLKRNTIEVSEIKLPKKPKKINENDTDN